MFSVFVTLNITLGIQIILFVTIYFLGTVAALLSITLMDLPRNVPGSLPQVTS